MNIEEIIRDAVVAQVKVAKEKVVFEAQVAFEKEVRRIVGNAAIDLSHYYSVEHALGGHELIIHVRLEKPGT